MTLRRTCNFAPIPEADIPGLFASIGDRQARPGVAYILPSLVETHVTLWGAEAAGYALPINFLLQTEHIAALLHASNTQILVALGPHPALDIWQKALAEPDVIDFHAALMAQPHDRLVAGDAGRDADVAAYFHTGGTTGSPKLVAHTHRGQLLAALGGAVLCDMRETDKLTGTLPLFHVAGTICGALSVFMAGAELLIMSPGGMRNPAIVQGFWRIIAQYAATLVAGVPTPLAATLEVPTAEADLSAMRSGLSGASPLPPSGAHRFKQVTGHKLSEVYGMTEASGLIAIDPCADEDGIGSVG